MHFFYSTLIKFNILQIISFRKGFRKTGYIFLTQAGKFEHGVSANFLKVGTK